MIHYYKYGLFTCQFDKIEIDELATVTTTWTKYLIFIFSWLFHIFQGILVYFLCKYATRDFFWPSAVVIFTFFVFQLDLYCQLSRENYSIFVCIWGLLGCQNKCKHIFIHFHNILKHFQAFIFIFTKFGATEVWP